MPFPTLLDAKNPWSRADVEANHTPVAVGSADADPLRQQFRR